MASDTLRVVAFDPPQDALPAAVAALLDDARRRVPAALGRHERIASFVESNYELAWHTLNAIAQRRLAPGRRFCEWGSGAGIVTCLASLAGFNAVGIEIEPPLVDVARRIAANHAPGARFRCDSYKPAGVYDDTVDPAGFRRGRDPAAFDIVYSYPWDPEKAVVMSLFRRFSPPGALLVVYHGGANMRLYRV